jgi:5-methyltetrahydrofolate--homocysteine methyltransferase
MKVSGLAKDFIIIGENIHATRVVLRKGKRVGTDPNGVESILFSGADGAARYLAIPDDIKKSQDYEEGRVKHVKIAVKAAMSDRDPEAAEGLEYLRSLVRRQEQTGADYLDLNVDEISLRPEEQMRAMQWLVRTVQRMTKLPVAIDSSNIDTLREGMQACDRDAARPLLNSASLERLDALDLARAHGSPAIVTAAGEAGMPQNEEERVANASRVVDAALAKGIPPGDLYIDPLVFPISVDGAFGNHCLGAIRRLRDKYGPDIHITGGLSNISFGLPCRSLLNDVFILLATDAGADSGIIDPVASHLDRVFSMDRNSHSFQLAHDVLLGKDRNCKNFLRAYRKGELQAT